LEEGARLEGGLQTGTRPLLSDRRLALAMEAGIVVVACLLFLAFTVPNLANHPVPSDDEIWVLSASHKLATEGVFGTDLFAGFYRSEDMYFFNMPGHHIVVAGVYKVFGTSILAGRLVAVVYGLVTLGLVYLLARRFGGWLAAGLAIVLILLLRLNIGFDTGLPLQEMSRTLRYDLAAVPFMVGGVLVLMKPTMLRVAVAGALFAIATLMQFFGVFMLSIGAVYLLLENEPIRQRLKLVGIMALASIAVALPYGVYVATNYDEFEGQTGTLERRINFSDPDFYINNVKRETKRFPLYWGTLRDAFTDRPSAKFAIVLGLPAAIAFAGWRAYRERSREQRLLFLCLAGFPLQLAVLDSQKIYYYWIGFVPFLAIGLASLCAAGIEAGRSLLAGRQFSAVKLAFAGVVGGFLLVVLVEGGYAQYQGTRVWAGNSDYLSLRERLAPYVPPGARVVGATALWWAMPETEYRSYYMLFYNTNQRVAENPTTISGYLDSHETEYIVFNRTSRFFLRRLVPSDYFELDGYLLRSGEEIAHFQDASYGFIEIWKIDRSKREAAKLTDP
jgi:4-amino-4-deoxy-L-arabinose transferase-like glycosyltransferase